MMKLFLERFEFIESVCRGTKLRKILTFDAT